MEYKEYELKDIGKIITGCTPKTKNEDYYRSNDYMFIGPSDLKNRKYVVSTEKYVSVEAFNDYQSRFIPGRSIIIDCIGSDMGNVAISTEQCLTNQQINAITYIDNEKFNVDYIYYILSTMKGYFHSIGMNGSTMPIISKSLFERIKIAIPEKNYQYKCALVLDKIDKKIELNNQINNNLYEISKQLLLKYLEDNNDSEEINISKLLNVFTGKKNANEASPTGKYKFFSCSPESLLSDTYIYDGPSIIVAGNGAYTGRTRFYEGKFELYQRTYGLTLKDNINKNNIYGLYVFMKAIFEPDKMGGTHGSAIPYIVLSDLTDYKLKYNKNEFNKFSNLVTNNIKLIQKNEIENEQLSQLRDTLLPKLMNGEIDLDNIEI